MFLWVLQNNTQGRATKKVNMRLGRRMNNSGRKCHEREANEYEINIMVIRI
jgi:hypothetical protein